MPSDFLARLRSGPVLCDGGMGSMLIAAGLARDEVPEAWNLAHPERVAAVHRAYAEAGAGVLQTNTFGASSLKLASSPAGRAVDVAAANEAAVALCRAAIGAAAPGSERWVAGDIGPTGLFFPPVGKLTAEAARASFREQARALERAGVDLFLIETMYDLREALEALRAVREVSSRPVAVELTFQRKPRGCFTLMGDDPATAFAALVREGADLVGANCTLSSAEMLPIVPLLRAATDAPLLVQPNAGRPEIENGLPVYRQTADEFAEDVAAMVRAGANAVGGCCGTNPEFIRSLGSRLARDAAARDA